MTTTARAPRDFIAARVRDMAPSPTLAVSEPTTLSSSSPTYSSHSSQHPGERKQETPS